MGQIEFRDFDILEMIAKPGYNNKNYLAFSLPKMGQKRPEDNKMVKQKTSYCTIIQCYDQRLYNILLQWLNLCALCF